MAVDHFGLSQAGNTRDIVKIGSELAVVANWNLDHRRFDFGFVLKS